MKDPVLLKFKDITIGLRKIDENLFSFKSELMAEKLICRGGYRFDSSVLNPNAKLQILMACKNSERFLQRSLKSIERCMVGMDWALVTLDDCSADSTELILRTHISSCKKRIHVKNQTESGNVNHTKNTLIQLAMTISDYYQYVCLVDSDDEVLDPMVTELFEKIKCYDLDVVIGSYECKNDSGFVETIIPTSEDFYFGTWASILKINNVTKDGLMFRSENPIHEDALSYVRMFASGVKMEFVKTNPVYRHWLHPSSITSMNIDMEKDWKSFEENRDRILSKELPKCFCTLVTAERWMEGVLMAKTLRKYHKEELIVIGDEKVEHKLKEFGIENFTFFPIPNSSDDIIPRWNSSSYHGIVVSKKYFAVKKAFERYNNTLYIDSDVIVINPFDEGFTGDVAGTRHHKNGVGKIYGEYAGIWNSGLLMIKDEYFYRWWKQASVYNSLMGDQQCLNYASQFSLVEMGKNYNVGFWRLGENDSTVESSMKELGIQIRDGNLFLGEKELKNFHSHIFLDEHPSKKMWKNMNNMIKFCLKNSSNHSWILDEYEYIKSKL